MMLYGFLAIGLFLILAELCYFYRGKQVSSIRAQAREIIFHDPLKGLWNQVERFNSYGTWEDMFWSWRFSFNKFYPDLLPTNIHIY